MATVGFDSFVLSRPLPNLVEVPEGVSPSVYRPSSDGTRGFELVFKAMVGASVKTADYDAFIQAYENALRDALTSNQVPQKRPIYKAAHLAKQSLHKTPQIISDLLTNLMPVIERIDIYCAYYNQPFVSCFGEAQGERLLPIVFIEKNQNAFPHVCAWKYLVEYPNETGLTFHIDHFTSKITPAWRDLTSSNVSLEVFHSGGQCNPLIATADVILRLIELFQYGTVDGDSLLDAIRGHVASLRPKLRFHNLGGRGEDQHHTAPVVRIDIDLSNYLKRPMYYVVWRPKQKRADLEPSFEWGKFYLGVIAEAMRTRGCLKFFDPEVDVLFWDAACDFVSPFDKDEQDFLSEIKKTGHDIPPVFRPIT